jgi:hypothetical protein
MDFNSVAALSAAVAAFFSFVALVLTYFQIKQFRFAHSVDLVFDLEHRFDAPEMINDRKLAAKALLGGTCGQEIEPVLDFFETLGVFVRRNAVDEELVWNSFSYWVLRYAVLAHSQIEARRKEESDSTYWQEFESLVKRLTRIETKRRHLKSPPSFSKEQLKSFLIGEISD